MVHLVTILFKDQISTEEIPFFRGCMIRYAGENSLFHNHENEKLRYSYPLIQYKRINGCAALIGINEGGEVVERLMEGGRLDCRLGNRALVMEVDAIRSEKRSIDLGERMYTYDIKRWLPLNSENYKQFLRTDSLIERVRMLESILVGNILSFAKGVGVYFDAPVLCRISQLDNEGVFRYKDVDLMSFSARFQANVSLPDLIGLGKSVSINNGVITRV